VSRGAAGYPGPDSSPHEPKLNGPAFAHFDTTNYSCPGGGSGCHGAIDPVSLVLYGPDAWYTRARRILEDETGWYGDDSANQAIGSHGICDPMDGESKTDCDVCSRNHVRLNKTYHRDLKNRWETLGTPHDEDFVLSCPGHAVVSFNSARNRILNAMNPPYAYSYQYWGNTAVLRQCDGRGASSDGYVVWINIG
jgi:hypothetical protein